METTVGVITGLLAILLIWTAIDRFRTWWHMTPEQRKAARAEQARRAARDRMQEQWGYLKPAMICPHCQTKGDVRTKAVTRKKGISGAKATGALLTGGVSMLATGLSRKEGLTQAHCDHCNSTWDF